MADKEKDTPTLVVGTANIDPNSAVVEVEPEEGNPKGAEPVLMFVGTTNVDPNSSMVEVDEDAPPQPVPAGALPEPEPERASPSSGEGVPKAADKGGSR